MAAAARLAGACDRLYNQGRAVPWFSLLLEALALSPSELFERFAAFLAAHPDADTTALQVAFFDQCFQGGSEGPVAADLVTYFGRSGALLEATSEALEAQPCLASFHHDPQLLLDLLGSGVTDLVQLASLLPAHPCRARFEREGEEVCLHLIEADAAGAGGDQHP